MTELFTTDAIDPGAGSPLSRSVPPDFRIAARARIPAWSGYARTPLRALPGLARELGLGQVLAKDEGGRFGLGSFKALGGAFAVAMAVDGFDAVALAEAVVVTASDGNHGLSVAWGARRAGCRCRVYLHENVAEARAALIREQGAEVVRVAGNYDDSTHRAREDALREGWILVADTAIDKTDTAPGQVMAGYTVMMDEIADQLSAMGTVPTHVFVQGGCGGLAAAAFGVLHEYYGAAPRLVMVEPDKADCLFQSARAGHPVRIDGDLDTIMGGLSVGEVSLSAWRTIERIVGDYLVIPDAAAEHAMTLLGKGAGGDAPLVAGDAGSAGIAGLIEAASDPDIRARLGLGADSVVLTIVTEGAVDAGGYRAITGLDPVTLGALA